MAFRQTDYYFPRVQDAEYIAVFTDRDKWPLTDEKFENELNKYLNSKEWEVLINDHPLLILKKDKNPYP